MLCIAQSERPVTSVHTAAIIRFCMSLKRAYPYHHKGRIRDEAS